MPLTGNKGEWSEVYAFFRLLDIGKLYAADEDLNKIDSAFYDVLKILREEDIGKLEFVYNKQTQMVSVVNTTNQQTVVNIPSSTFKEEADQLYNGILNARGASFSLEESEAFLTSLGVGRLKARWDDKADIKIRLHDINTGFEAVQGFSIKSRLGSPATLINAGQTTNFIYEVVGGINDAVMEEFNTCSSLFRRRFEVLCQHNCDLKYVDMANAVFKNNMILIDGVLPQITAYLLIEYYRNSCGTVASAVERITELNPLGFDTSAGHPFYSYKFKKLLSECALGMLPSRTWNGVAVATGGYIIVREDGEVLCYHLFNRNEFENYLLKNTRFETASTSRHGFGSIYKSDEKYYIKLNLQVRFIA